MQKHSTAAVGKRIQGSSSADILRVILLPTGKYFRPESCLYENTPPSRVRGGHLRGTVGLCPGPGCESKRCTHNYTTSAAPGQHDTHTHIRKTPNNPSLQSLAWQPPPFRPTTSQQVSKDPLACPGAGAMGKRTVVAAGLAPVTTTGGEGETAIRRGVSRCLSERAFWALRRSPKPSDGPSLNILRHSLTVTDSRRLWRVLLPSMHVSAMHVSAHPAPSFRTTLALCPGPPLACQRSRPVASTCWVPVTARKPPPPHTREMRGSRSRAVNKNALACREECHKEAERSLILLLRPPVLSP